MVTSGRARKSGRERNFGGVGSAAVVVVLPADPVIAMIARLVETGHAYEADGHVLFHVPSDPDYGALGRRDRDAMIAGARVEVASYKKDPADFVLGVPPGRVVLSPLQDLLRPVEAPVMVGP